MDPQSAQFIAKGIAIFAMVGTALGEGYVVGKTMEAIGRNPEASSKIQTNMVLAIVFAEALGIYALVVALIILFVS